MVVTRGQAKRQLSSHSEVVISNQLIIEAPTDNQHHFCIKQILVLAVVSTFSFLF